MAGLQQAEDTLNLNYVAFAPGFSDELKREYAASVTDSMKLDKQYLSLLPQPNTGKLVRKFKSLLGGETFMNQSSTPAEFRKNAGGHKIIHIGTHAEYNNINPERSRLIFAKTPVTSTDTNSLFLYDIYNCNVNSDLTLLTACETGRPGYQDGEGMVSLAHAFNYAGSRSILTGLWKIDEQSSTQITESFMHHLKEGLPSDEALRQAKLDYLSGNPDRLLAPAYWSGLVLMGKPGMIRFEDTGVTPWWWVLAGTAVLSLIFFLYRRRKKE
jgi:LPXTG-motif cell wall-anchored protein